MKNRIASAALLLSLLFSLVSCKENPKPKSRSLYDCFDTVITVSDYSGLSDGDFDALFALVAGEYEQYHRLYDIYNEYDGINNLATLNAAGGEWVELDSRITDLLSYGKEIHALTDGTVNIAMGAVLSIWHGYRAEGLSKPEAAALPDMAELMAAAEHCDVNGIEIDAKNGRARLNDKELRVDVGAVAKGYATERIAELLSSEGYVGVVLNAGGNVRIVGSKPNGGGFSVGIENPDRAAGGYSFVLTLADTAVVTSGAYQRYYTVDGKRYGHIIDGETLMPAERFASVSITVKDSALADVLSTALFIMSYEDGRALIETVDGADAYWVMLDGAKKTTKE